MQPMRTIIKNAKKYVVFRVLPFILACLMLFTSAPLAVFSVSVPECDCTNTSTDLSAHTDSCAKKSYIRNTYIKENTAEQIYAEWSSLDTDIQTAVLTFLNWDDYTKYTALTALINSGDTSDGYPTTGSDKIAVDMDIPEGAFPEGTQMSIQPIDAKDYCTDIETAISDIDDSSEVLALYAFDISFLNNGEELQPSQSIGITFTVPASLVPSDARTAHVFHIADDGNAEQIESFYNIDSTSQYTYYVKAESFSSYVIAYTGQNYKAPLLRDVLKNDPDFSIVTLPVTLYDYDTDKFNAAIAAKANGKSYLKFTTDSEDFLPNSGSSAATMGILKNKLSYGLPSMMYGYDNGADIFGTASVNGKTVYENVQFEFVYNKKTGYYEYDSTLNHAQYNKSTNKIELYTDTLGPYNFLTLETEKVTLSKDIKLVSGTFPETAKYNVTGKDPYIRVYLKEETEITDNNRYLYFRMYAPKNQEKGDGTGAEIYLFSSTTSLLGIVSLDLKAGWNDYFFDLSDYMGETLDNVSVNPGAYTDNVSNATVEFEAFGFIDNEGNMPTSMSKAGFYPFANISKTYPNLYTEFNLAEWKKQYGVYPDDVRATRAYYNEDLKDYSQCPTDPLFHFGVSIDLDFYLPVDYKEQDLSFNFSGDDDMWVFIDDTLVLDVGGAHTRVSGTIDFSSSTVSVSSARTLTSETSVTEKAAYSDNFPELSAGKMHNLKIFYLERASTASNCRFYFNLPTIPTGAVEVTKKVVDESGLADVKNIDFDFNIKVDNAPYANREFSVVTYNDSGKPVSVEARKTDGNGGFKLRHNQTASFADIDENKRVLVTETPDTRFTANASQLEKITVKDKTITFSFVNTVILTELVIDKTVSAVTKDENDFENPSFLFRVKGTGFTGNVDIIVSINITANDTTNNVGNDSVRIANIPIGFYTVTELTDWSWEYAAINTATAENVIKSSGATASEITVEIGKVNDNRNPTVFFTNTDTDPNWLNGEGHNENQFDIND